VRTVGFLAAGLPVRTPPDFTLGGSFVSSSHDWFIFLIVMKYDFLKKDCKTTCFSNTASFKNHPLRAGVNIELPISQETHQRHASFLGQFHR
jgi:hypothetical protein